MTTAPIYLDNHSTTAVDPRVLEAMLPFLRQACGNPANRTHAFGRAAEAAVERAREQVAALIGGRYSEIVFTAGATESNNLALKGATAALAERGRHIVTTAIEHKSVLEVCRGLETRGWRVTCLPVDPAGLVDPAAVAAAIRPDTVLVSVQAANNEVGTVQPLAAIGAACRAAGVLLHSDAAQAAGRMPLDVDALGVDLLSVSAHKFHGPKGAGALFVRRRKPRLALVPQSEGGGQELGLRSGTLNVPGIVGLGAACAIAAAEMATETVRIGALRDRLAGRLADGLGGIAVNGHPAARLAGNLNVSFDGVEAEALLLRLDGLAVSLGAACSSGLVRASYVLEAMGLGPARARSAVRFGIGRFNDAAEIDRAAAMVVDAVRGLRARGAA